MLSTVKKTLQKMTLTPDDNQASEHDLATMNVPPLMARRDAAYDRAIELLEQNMFSHTEEERRVIYEGVIELLNVSIDNTKAIINPTKTKDTFGAMLQYLILLNDTVRSANVLVKHELIMLREERDISNFIGKKAQSQFRAADKIFSNSEMNIFHSITELIDIAAPAIKKYRSFRLRTFGKNNLDRYNKALNEFKLLYRKTGVIIK